jgi:aminoglycoside phosphotransferase (APT) family kinase protein
MLMSSKRILEATAATLRTMSARADLPADVVPDCEMMAYLIDQIALPDDERSKFDRYSSEYQILTNFEKNHSSVTSSKLLEQIKAILIREDQVIKTVEPVANHLNFLSKADQLIAGKIVENQLDGKEYLELAKQSCDWEKSFISNADDAGNAGVGSLTDEFSIDKVQLYFDAKFPGQGCLIKRVNILPGGYGKQTIMIEVEGGPYPGSFVIRRDMGIAVLTNDCHFVRREFPLLKSLFKIGFPVPEVLWLEQNSAILPGGDFIVTRKIEGRVEGDVLGTKGDIPEALINELAKTVARLHQLPPLNDLGSQVASVDAALWNESITTCGRKYIETFYNFYRNTATIPQPALTAMFGWLINNIPECDEPPALIHGDLGFHNFLVNDNKITCLLDWEFCHVGDPAEDIGFIKSSIGEKIDWQHFLDLYQSYGGRVIDPRRILFYQVWTYLRNSVGCAITGYLFGTGDLNEVKLGVVPYRYIPIYIEKCLEYIESQ